MSESDQYKRCAFAIVNEAFRNNTGIDKIDTVVLYAMLITAGVRLQGIELSDDVTYALRSIFEDQFTSFLLDKDVKVAVESEAYMAEVLSVAREIRAFEQSGTTMPSYYKMAEWATRIEHACQ